MNKDHYTNRFDRKHFSIEMNIYFSGKNGIFYLCVETLLFRSQNDIQKHYKLVFRREKRKNQQIMSLDLRVSKLRSLN